MPNPSGIMMFNIIFFILDIAFVVAYVLPTVKKYNDYVNINKAEDAIFGDIIFLIIFVMMFYIYFSYMFKIPVNADIYDDYAGLLYNALRVHILVPIPFWIQLLAPSIFMGLIVWTFAYWPMKLPKIYLAELSNINKFTTFIMYNIEYYQNDRKIVLESLKGINEDVFCNDVRAVYEVDIPVEEKFKVLSKTYPFKFLFMFFNLFLITLEKGLSDQALLSLDIVKRSGDNYYTYMTQLYKSKQAACMIIFFIYGMMYLMLFIVRKSLGIGFTYYIMDYYSLYFIFQLGLMALLAVVTMKYKDNKLIAKEGRYV